MGNNLNVNRHWSGYINDMPNPAIKYYTASKIDKTTPMCKNMVKFSPK